VNPLDHKGTIQQKLHASNKQERQTQKFVRAITGGDIHNRDLLLSYPVGEFYNEMSLFIEEEEAKKKAFDEAKSKLK
jgi:hypothetical protein